jgi:RND family efflux transporter MFP subunit
MPSRSRASAVTRFPCRRTFAAAVSLALGGAACNRGPAQEGVLAELKKREPARVLVAPVETREMVRRIETTTRVESESQVQVYPRAEGVVVELAVEEGDPVAADQVLAQLDDRDARLRVDDARAALEEARGNQPKLDLAVREFEARLSSAQRSAEQAERDHARNVSLAETRLDAPALLSSKDLEASQLAVDRATAEWHTAEFLLERAKVEREAGKTAVDRAQVALQRAELELSFTRIVAPVAGVVSERGIKVGDTVSATTAAFSLTDPMRLRAVFYRPQRELPLFRVAPAKPGNGSGAHGAAPTEAERAITAFAEALPGHRFLGRIQRIAPTIDAASGNFRVTAELDGSAEGAPAVRLLPGMLVRIEIVTERHPHALVVKKRALRHEGDQASIFVVRDGVARAIAVEPSLADDEWVEVAPKAGATLAPGELAIVVGNRDLEDGAPVEATADGVEATLERGADGD